MEGMPFPLSLLVSCTATKFCHGGLLFGAQDHTMTILHGSPDSPPRSFEHQWDARQVFK